MRWHKPPQVWNNRSPPPRATIQSLVLVHRAELHFLLPHFIICTSWITLCLSSCQPLPRRCVSFLLCPPESCVRGGSIQILVISICCWYWINTSMAGLLTCWFLSEFSTFLPLYHLKLNEKMRIFRSRNKEELRRCKDTERRWTEPTSCIRFPGSVLDLLPLLTQQQS